MSSLYINCDTYNEPTQIQQMPEQTALMPTQPQCTSSSNSIHVEELKSSSPKCQRRLSLQLLPHCANVSMWPSSE